MKPGTEPVERTPEQALAAFSALELTGWSGLVDPTPVEEAVRVLGGDAQRYGRWFLGRPPREAFYLPVVLATFAGRVRIWYRDGLVLQVSGDHPVLAPEALATLSGDWGAPELRLDYASDVVRVPGGEHVYPDRGLAVRFNLAGDKAVGLAAFAATTAQRYLTELAADDEGSVERPMSRH